MRDYAEYLSRVQALCETLRGVLPLCEIELKATRRAGSNISGVIRTASGFELEVRYERFVYDKAERRERAHYCYDIKRDGNPLIRLETDRNPKYSPHAHIYRPDLPGSESHHFAEDRWPDRIKKPNLLKIYAFFQEIVRFEALPPPFGDGGTEQER